jgi:uncharacterized protein with PIN domain
MALNSEQIALLLKMIRNTHEVELSCPECLDELDKYAQSILDGMPIDGVLERVREHLEACPCCNEQYQLVLDTLKAIEE